MVKYVSKKTGAIIETDCKLLGDWVLFSPSLISEVAETPKQKGLVELPKVEESLKQEPIEPSVIAPVNPTGADDAYDSITVAQIKQELDAFGIEYDKRANKQVLFDLMMSQGK